MKANGHYQRFHTAENHVVSGSLLHRPTDPHDCDTPPQVIASDHAVLPDGRIIDLVTTGPRQELAFVVWHGGEFTHATEVRCDGAIYIPPQLPKNLETAAQLPSAIGPLVTAREMIIEIHSCLRTFVDLPEDDAFMVAVFALCSFFADCLGFAPYLAVCGPPGSGKSTLLRFLRCVTRRGLLAGEISRASLYKLTDLLSPTLLIDEADFANDRVSRDIVRLLRNGNRSGADTYVNGERFRTFGPKAISSRVPLDDAALASRAIHINMLPSSQNLATLDLEQEEKITDGLQPKLERFRLEHYHRLRLPQELDLSGMSARMRDICRTLAAPLIDDPGSIARLVSCLRAQDSEARLGLYGEPEWAVALALFVVCHQPESRVFIGNLAAEVGRVLAAVGEAPLTAKAVGMVARRSLGAETVKVGRGFYLQLSPARRRQIHSLARRMGLTRADTFEPETVKAGFSGASCQFCTEFGLNTLSDGSELRCVPSLSGRNRRRLFDEAE